MSSSGRQRCSPPWQPAGGASKLLPIIVRRQAQKKMPANVEALRSWRGGVHACGSEGEGPARSGVDVRELISRRTGRGVSRCAGHRIPGDVTGKEAWKMKIWKMKMKAMALVPAVLAAAVVLTASP